MACGGAGAGGWELAESTAVWAPPLGNDGWKKKGKEKGGSGMSHGLEQISTYSRAGELKILKS